MKTDRVVISSKRQGRYVYEVTTDTGKKVGSGSVDAPSDLDALEQLSALYKTDHVRFKKQKTW